MAATIRILVETSGGLDKVKSDIDDLGGRAKKAGGGFNALQEIATAALAEANAAAAAAAVLRKKVEGS